jgi:hypothetical protein
MIQQIPESEFSGPPLTEAASIKRTPETLQIGIHVVWGHYDEDGWGPGRFALFSTEDETLFCLQHFEQSPRADLMTLLVSPEDMPGNIDRVLEALDFTSSDIDWLHPSVTLNRFRLVRQDDHGGQFAIGEFACRADAQAALNGLEAAVHKQTYFLEPLDKARVC